MEQNRDPIELPLELDVHQAQQKLLSDSEVLLLDCREPFEAQICQLPESVLIPIPQLLARFGELEEYRDRPVIVYCHHGIRSLQVTQWLRGKGFQHVQSMSGGIDAWSQLIDSNIPTY